MITAASLKRDSALVPVLLINALVILHFWDRGWLAADDGCFAHIAERLLSGQVLQRDIAESHPGAVHLLNALWLRLFGNNLSSLHIVPAALAWVQSVTAYAILQKRSSSLALIAAAAAGTVGFLQIVSPSPHVYCLFLAFMGVSVLELTPQSRGYRIFLTGLYAGFIFIMRQPSGLFFGLGAAVYLMSERSGTDPRPARSAAFFWRLLSVGLAGYLVMSTSFAGWLSAGLWPVVALWIAGSRIPINARTAGRTLAPLLLGAVTAVVPLALYHVLTGSSGDWLENMFRGLHNIGSLPHLKSADYGIYYLGALNDWINVPTLGAKANGFYWAILPALSAWNGLWFLDDLSKNRRVHALPAIAVFFSLVSLFNQNPFYLYATTALTLGSLLYQSADRRQGAPRWAGSIALFVCLIAVMYHAGQPYTRSFEQMVKGERARCVRVDDLTKARIWMDAAEARTYRQLVDAIREQTGPSDPIFVFPNNAEVYYLAERKNPFRVWNSSIDLQSAEDIERFMMLFKQVRPALVIYNSESVYATDAARALLADIMRDHAEASRIGSFIVYRKR